MDSPQLQDVPLNMNAWLTWVLNLAKNHGLPFFLLMVAVWYFHTRTEKLEAQIEDCQTRHIETITTQNGALVRALTDNTQALNRLEASLKR